MKITDTTPRAYEFACHSAACRPPTSGGTGGSRATKAGQGMGNARGAMGTAKYVRSDGTPVSANYPGARRAKLAEDRIEKSRAAVRSETVRQQELHRKRLDTYLDAFNRSRL